MGYWGWGLLAGLSSFAFFVLIVVLLVSLLRSTLRPHTTVSPRALRVLEERYARGEISRDEFFERRAILLGTRREAA